MDIATGLAAAGQAMAILKGLRELDKSYDQVVLKGQIVDLMDQILDIRVSLQDAKAALEEKDQAIAQLISANATKVKTVMYRGYRYAEMDGDPGKPSGRPYCLRCEQRDGRLMGTVANTKGRGVMCPDCNSTYTDANRFYHTLADKEAAGPG